MSKKIGILGGSFNPIHIGHILMCRYSYEQLDLEKVYLMPNEKPPHKKGDQSMLSAVHRLNMCKIVQKNNDFIETISVEIGNNKTNYTVETMSLLLENQFKNFEIYFIVGADSMLQIETWREYEKLFQLINFVCIMRPSYNKENVENKINSLERKYDITIDRIEMPLIGLSSTNIRKRILENKSIKYMLDSDVIDYIYSNSLFS
jgi:nicotinate-nucleotide adenylyltransferase